MQWGKGENRIGVWWEKYEGKNPLGKPRRRWERNMKRDVEEIG
jgi:hypothetical protein